MNTNGTNPGMNVEDYEDKAVQKSNVAKRVAVGGAAFVGGAALAGGAAYAAGKSPAEEQTEEALTTEDIMAGAEAGGEAQPEEVQPQPQQTVTTERVVVVEKPAAETYQEEAKEAEGPEITWDETTNIYVGDQKVAQIERGTIDGSDFALIDGNADGRADVLAVDANNNKQFDQDEFVAITPEDNIYMGHQTAQVNNNYYEPQNEGGYDPYGGTDNNLAMNEEPIRNDFEDEKTGEEYHGDFAENNPDYNPDANVDNYDSANDGGDYLAENDSYDGGDGNYSAGMESDVYNPETDGNQLVENATLYGSDSERVEEYDIAAEDDAADDLHDPMMGDEEFIS